MFSYAESGVEMALTRGFRPRGLGGGSALGLSRGLVFVVGVVFGLRVVALVVAVGLAKTFGSGVSALVVVGVSIGAGCAVGCGSGFKAMAQSRAAMTSSIRLCRMLVARLTVPIVSPVVVAICASMGYRLKL